MKDDKSREPREKKVKKRSFISKATDTIRLCLTRISRMEDEKIEKWINGDRVERATECNVIDEEVQKIGGAIDACKENDVPIEVTAEDIVRASFGRKDQAEVIRGFRSLKPVFRKVGVLEGEEE